jgi:hypothetical protein
MWRDFGYMARNRLSGRAHRLLASHHIESLSALQALDDVGSQAHHFTSWMR